MKLVGRKIHGGKAEGEAIVLDEPFGFLGGVEQATGRLLTHKEGNIAGKVFVFPSGKGSTVGSFVMYDLHVKGKGPAAVVNETAETIVTTGAVISSTPMVDSIDVSLIRDGDLVRVDADAGAVELPNVREIHAVSSVVDVGDGFIMLKRPSDAKSYPGRWSLCAGKIERGERPADAAVREIKEELDIDVGEPASSLEPIMVREKDRIWVVYPFLFEAPGAVPKLNGENRAWRKSTVEDLDPRELVEKTAEAVRELYARKG
ncbi:MAG: DUF126 domain-containing protein [Thermoplasmatales archaeon]|nr:DUF126 domain-containing protein [Thermoplasmatales archaeon]